MGRWKAGGGVRCLRIDLALGQFPDLVSALGV